MNISDPNLYGKLCRQTMQFDDELSGYRMNDGKPNWEQVDAVIHDALQEYMDRPDEDEEEPEPKQTTYQVYGRHREPGKIERFLRWLRRRG